MFYYLWIFGWLLFIGYFEAHTACYRKEWVPGINEPVYRLKPMMAFIIILPMILWVGYREFWFADTIAYYSNFNSCPVTWHGFLGYLPTISKDKAFYAISAFIKLFTTDVRTYFIIFAFVQGICLLKLFRKYSSDYIMSIFLFIASTDIYSWMFNGMRQFTAVAITLLSSQFILRKKYATAVVIILIASLFHQTALLMLPFVFIVQGKAWNWKTLSVLIAAMLMIIFVGQFTGWLDSTLESTQYANVVGDYTSWNDDGTNPIRVLVYAVPTILAFIGRKRIKNEGSDLINFCINMSIVSTSIYLFSIFSSGIFMGRLPIYFSLYGYILLPWEIKHIFGKKDRSYIKYAMIICYMAFYVYQMHFEWGYM